jgi:hypothetical protein
MKMLKWQKEYLDKVSKMTNEEVFNEYSYLCGGDDYDGCHTSEGEWKFDVITKEFIDRLKTPLERGESYL